MSTTDTTPTRVPLLSYVQETRRYGHTWYADTLKPVLTKDLAKITLA